MILCFFVQVLSNNPTYSQTTPLARWARLTAVVHMLIRTCCSFCEEKSDPKKLTGELLCFTLNWMHFVDVFSGLVGGRIVGGHAMNNECHIYIISMGGNATERDEKGIMIFVEWKLTVLMY